jgi:hypothetical protein
MRKIVQGSPLLSPILGNACSFAWTNDEQLEKGRKAASVPPAVNLRPIAALTGIPLIPHVLHFRLFSQTHQIFRDGDNVIVCRQSEHDRFENCSLLNAME